MTFAYFNAFSSLLSKIELFKRIYLSAARGVSTYQMTQDDFLLASQTYAQITPYEVRICNFTTRGTIIKVQVEILYRMVELIHPGRKYITYRDFEMVDPERLKRQGMLGRITNIKAVESPAERGYGTAVSVL